MEDKKLVEGRIQKKDEDKELNVLYINLDKRTDRREHVEKELSSVGMRAERFKAIELKNGRVGCSMSHLRCIEIAKNRNWDHVFVCEDDITFTKPKLFTTQLRKFLLAGLPWDVVIIAGNNLPPYTKFGDFCIKVSHCQTTTGYIVRKHYYNTLIKNYREGIKLLMKHPNRHREFAIDKNWTKLQKIHNWFMIVPASVIQRPDYSDIEGREINYNWHLLDIDKKAWIEKRALTREERKKHFDGEMRRGGNTSQMWNLLYKRDNK